MCGKCCCFSAAYVSPASGHCSQTKLIQSFSTESHSLYFYHCEVLAVTTTFKETGESDGF